ncbi:MAG TPA: M14 family zinc carboxypeptidase [Candidatus Limnocylindria bacterium]|nr:M14 family zinc carboxypeptidase [Candidatus Limnocylindria bacterium]
MIRSLALALLLVCPVLAWSAEPSPQLLKIPVGADVTVGRLFEAGMDVIEVRGDVCLVLAWPGDVERLKAAGTRFELLDPDPSRTAALRAQAERSTRPRLPGRIVSSATEADGVFRTAVLPAFGDGSMGGYWTLDEVKMKLDQLVADDLADVVADAIDTLGYSRQNRPIWGLKLGKRVEGTDTRPVAFYNSLTHAREPAGMQALLYFADDLLSKYGTDPTATYLLDHRVIYIVPVVNPDGYVRNQTTNPAGGGLWRKNCRDNNGDGTINNADGVDINRNYGFQWGLASGASSTPSAPDYRGPMRFSEPETQAQRDRIALSRPVTGLSFHTYSDLLLHPWGYTAVGAPDSSKFHEWNDDITLGNGYHGGQGPRILYPVSGEFNDWCYGDTLLKPRAFTWTPEVGGPYDGFWPPPSRILPLALENLRSCLYVAAIAGPYVRVESSTVLAGVLNAGFSAQLAVRARNKGMSGLAGPGLTGTLSPLSPGARVLQSSVAYPDLGSMQSADAQSAGVFQVAADDTVTPGRLLRFQLDFTAPDGFFSRDTVELVCGTPTLLVTDGADAGVSAWTTSAWGTESADPLHPGPFFVDSPNARYASGTDQAMTLTAPLDLSNGIHAYALFDTRWEFEGNYDYGSVEASRDGIAWTPLASTGTSLGREADGVQPVGAPIFEGARRLWRAERASLDGFTGQGANAVRFRFRVRSDTGLEYDGFAIDAVRIALYDPAQQPMPVAVDTAAPGRLALAAPFPNPARGTVRLAFDLPAAAAVRLEVLDVQGRHVRTLSDGLLAAGRYAHGWDGRDDAGRPVAAGLYLARLTGGPGAVTRRFVVMR